MVVIAPSFKSFFVDWRIPESKIAVIENWAPLDEVPQVSRVNRWSTVHGLESKPVLLYSGTLGLKHRPDLIYLLAEKLGEKCTVVVISEGIGREHLEQMPALPNLVILGFQPYELMPDVLASADVLLGTLEADAGQFAVPSKVLTYLCVGRSILLAAPKENLAASIVERSGAGLVVDPNDASAWVAAADRLLSDANFRARLAANARRYAESTFDVENIAAKFEQILISSYSRYIKQSVSASAVSVISQN